MDRVVKIQLNGLLPEPEVQLAALWLFAARRFTWELHSLHNRSSFSFACFEKLTNSETWRPRAQAASALWASWWGKRSHLGWKVRRYHPMIAQRIQYKLGKQ